MTFVFRNDWREWMYMPKFNWTNFRIITLELEYDKIGPQIDITLVLMGIGFCVAIGLPWETAQSKHLIEVLKEMHPVKDEQKE